MTLPLRVAIETRAREALRLALLPGAGAAAAVLAAFWPSVAARLQGILNHCLTAGARPHLCFFHAEPAALCWHDAPVLLPVAAFVALIACRVGGWMLAARQLGRLRQTSDPKWSQALGDTREAAGVALPGVIWVVPSDTAAVIAPKQVAGRGR